MKRFFIYISLHMVVVSCPPVCLAQVSRSGSQAYRDSLYRHIGVEGSANLSCQFTYAQGSSVIYVDLAGNASELNKLDAFIRSALAHPNLFIERIRLTGYSSIEGNYNTNEQLSRERVECFYNYLREHYPDLYSYPHDLAWVAEDWDGLSKLVRQSNINERDEILEIIRKVRGFDVREELLVKLNGGSAYSRMERTIFPKLRRVEIEIVYNSLTPALSFGEGWGEAVGTWNEAVGSSVGTWDEAGGSRAILAIKANALLWSGVQSDFKHTAPVANVALEYYINRNWSVEAGAMYSYWNYNNNVEFQGLSGYYLEPRFRVPLFSNKLEVFTGVYGRVGDYDQRKRSLTPALSQGEGAEEVTTASYTGKYYDMGLSAGLSIQLFGGFGIEFGARTGYVKTKAAMYTHENGENWFDEYQHYNKIKVTDLNLSLVYRLK